MGKGSGFSNPNGVVVGLRWNGAGCNRRAGTAHVSSGSAISHGNSESHRTSKDPENPEKLS